MAKNFGEFLDKKIGKKTSSGSLLRSFRKSLDLTQGDLVEITQIKRPNISKLENDEIPMTAQYAERFAAALGIHPSTLLYPNGEFNKKGDLIKIERKAQKILQKKRA